MYTSSLFFFNIMKLCHFYQKSAIWDLAKWTRQSGTNSPEYPDRTTDPGQATGKLYHLRLRVECCENVSLMFLMEIKMYVYLKIYKNPEYFILKLEYYLFCR